MGPDAVERLKTGLTSSCLAFATHVCVCVCVIAAQAGRPELQTTLAGWMPEHTRACARAFYDGQMAISERGAGIAMTYVCVAQVI